jgi:methionyl-tRNA formyltransferase
MGTPEFAVPTLKALLDTGHKLLAVYTRAPRQAGRGLGVRPSPVHEAAWAAGLKIETPESLRSADVQVSFAALDADAAIVVAYGLLLPRPVLDAPRLGSLNLHASLLPRWRGAAPINRAIMAGDRETGLTIMRMTEGLDEGPCCLVKRLQIGENETAGELHDRLASAGANLMVQALSRLEQGVLGCVPQPPEGATYASKITKAGAHIDFNKPAREVLDHIRGLSPIPGAWCILGIEGKPQRLKILKAELADGQGPPGQIIDHRFAIACAKGAIRPLVLQRQAKAALPLAEFLRGQPLKPGDRLE